MAAIKNLLIEVMELQKEVRELKKENQYLKTMLNEYLLQDKSLLY